MFAQHRQRTVWQLCPRGSTFGGYQVRNGARALAIGSWERPVLIETSRRHPKATRKKGGGARLGL
jgi:hypothetical protein